MVYTATYTISDDFDANLSTNYDENFSIQVLNCSDPLVVNLKAPEIWITNFGSPGLTSTVFLEPSIINPSFQVLAFTISDTCSNDKLSSNCCSKSIAYSVKTILSDNSENTLGFASIENSRKISIDLTKSSPRTDEIISQTLKLQVIATTSDGAELVKEQSLTLVKCSQMLVTPNTWLMLSLSSQSITATN
jgi:hypothetical protein